MNRVLGEKHDAWIDRDAWPVPPLFRFLVEAGELERDEAHRALNMGIGMVIVCEPRQVAPIEAALRAAGEPCWRIGEVTPGEGLVRWKH